MTHEGVKPWVGKDGPVVMRVGWSSPVEIELGAGAVKAERSFTRQRRIGVTLAGNDDIGQVLQRLDIPYETVEDVSLRDGALLSHFSTLFLNCSAAAVQQAAGSGRALAAWVADGGSLHASDWAGAYVHAAFPGSFVGEHSGTAGVVRAAILHPDAQRLLGRTGLDLHFDMPSWYRVNRFAPPRYGEGDVYVAAGRCPLMLAFRYGRGQVVFTSFHNRAQPGDTVEKLLKFLVLVPVVSDPAVSARVIELAAGNLRRYLELEPGS